MQMGFNNEFDYREKRFHIQTEDQGLKAAKIESHIFTSGNILDTNVVSYESLLEADLDEDERDSKIQTMMKYNHRLLYQRLMNGEYDHLVGLEPIAKGKKSSKKGVSKAAAEKPVPPLEPEIDTSADGDEAIPTPQVLKEKLARPEMPTQILPNMPPLVASNDVLSLPDTGVAAYRGLQYQETSLNVTDLILKAI